MMSLLLITENKREEEILKVFLEQAQFKVVLSKPSYSNYIKSIQYDPGAILIEMPHNYSEHLNFTRLVKNNKKTMKIPVMAFGNHMDNQIIEGFRANGTNLYYPRPLKTGKLIQDMTAMLQKAGKVIAIPEKKEDQDLADDIALILDKSKLATTKIDRMVQRVKKLLAFPFTVAKVLKITHSEDSGAGDLAKAIQADPVITAGILKVANSIFFAGRDKRISDVQEAIVRVGFTETKNIAMAFSVLKIFAKQERNIGFDRVEFWYHSLACAIIAEKLAKNGGYAHPEQAFISGLLHDFGIIILDEFFGELFEKVIEQATRHGTSFVDEEKKLMGIDHLDVSEKLFELWKMPDEVSFTVKNYGKYASVTDKELLPLVTSVGVAHVISKSMQIGRECDLHVEPVLDDSFQRMKYPAGLRDGFWEDVYAQLNMFNAFLNIGNRTFPGPVDSMKDADKTGIAIVNRENSLYNPIDRYLGTQGYRLIKVKMPKEIEKLTPTPDLIIVHSKKEDTMESFHPFLSIIKKVPGQAVDPGNLEFLPVLVFYDSGSVLEQAEPHEKLRKLENRIDLRNIDQAIEKLSSGNPWVEDVPLDIAARKIDGGITVADISGSIQINNLADLKQHFVNVFTERTKYLALNFTKMSAIDSSGIRLLINVHKRMTASNGKLCLFGLNNKVKNALESANLTRVFVIAEDESSLYGVLGIGQSLAENAGPVAAQEIVPAAEAEQKNTSEAQGVAVG